MNKNQNKQQKKNAYRRRQQQKQKRAYVATTTQRRTRAPVMRTSNTECVITHTELIGSVVATSSDFTVSSYFLNPGNPTTFPWLCQMATRYETYQFKSLNFQFKTMQPTTTGGAICLAVDYDPSDSPPSTKEMMMSYSGARRSAPWSDIAHPCRRSDLNKHQHTLYTSSSNDRNNQTAGNLRTRDAGTFYIATKGIVTPNSFSNLELGELYVSYTVVLRTPQFEVPPQVTTSEGATFRFDKNVFEETAKYLRMIGKKYVQTPVQFGAQTIQEIVTKMNSASVNNWGKTQILEGVDPAQVADTMAYFLKAYTRYRDRLEANGDYIVDNSGGPTRVDHAPDEIIDWNTLGVDARAMLDTIVMTYGTNWGIDLQSIAETAFRGSNLTFSYSNTMPTVAGHGKQEDKLDASITTKALPLMRWQQSGDKLPTTMEDYSAESLGMKQAWTGLPTGGVTYYGLRFTNFEGVDGANLNVKVFSILDDADMRAGLLAGSTDTSQYTPVGCAVYRIDSQVFQNKLSRSHVYNDNKSHVATPFVNFRLYGSPNQTSWTENDNPMAYAAISLPKINITAQAHDDQGNSVGGRASISLTIPVINEYNDLWLHCMSYNKTLRDFVRDSYYDSMTQTTIPHLYSHSQYFKDASDGAVTQPFTHDEIPTDIATPTSRYLKLLEEFAKLPYPPDPLQN